MEPWDSESSQKREQKAGLYLLPGGGPRAPSLRFAVAAHGSSCEMGARGRRSSVVHLAFILPSPDLLGAE